MATLETERLYFRPLNIEDAERIEELVGDYDVARENNVNDSLSVPERISS